MCTHARTHFGSWVHVDAHRQRQRWQHLLLHESTAQQCLEEELNSSLKCSHLLDPIEAENNGHTPAGLGKLLPKCNGLYLTCRYQLLLTTLLCVTFVFHVTAENSNPTIHLYSKWSIICSICGQLIYWRNRIVLPKAAITHSIKEPICFPNWERLLYCGGCPGVETKHNWVEIHDKTNIPSNTAQEEQKMCILSKEVLFCWTNNTQNEWQNLKCLYHRDLFEQAYTGRQVETPINVEFQMATHYRT